MAYQRYRDKIENPLTREPIAAAQVRVRDTVGAEVQVYSGRDGGSVSQPLYTDEFGLLSFYAPDGQYQLAISKVGYADAVLLDITVGGGSNIGGATTAAAAAAAQAQAAAAAVAALALEVEDLAETVGEGGGTGPTVPGTLPLPSDDSAIEATYRQDGTQRSVAPSILVAESLRSDSFPVLDIRQKPYGIKPGVPDASDALAALIADKVAQYGFISLQSSFSVPVTRQIEITSRVDLSATSMRAGFQCIDGSGGYFDGASLFQHTSTDGVTANRWKISVEKMRLTGNGVSRFLGATGTVTRGSIYVTGVTMSSAGAVKVRNWLQAGRSIVIDGYGIDTLTVVVGIAQTGGTWTLEMSKAAKFSNGVKTQLYFRESAVFTGSIAAGSSTLTCTGADVANIRRYFRVAQLHALDDGDNDIGKFNRVQSLTVVGSTATVQMRAPALTTLTNVPMVAWYEVGAWESLSQPDDDKDYPGINFTHVEAFGFGGWMWRNNGLGQVHWVDCKGAGGDRGVLNSSGANDCFSNRTGAGNVLYTPVAFGFGATPRASGEGYLPYKHGQYCFDFTGLREGAIVDTDVNGAVRLKGVPGSDAKDLPMISLIGVNRKWFTSNKAQDSTERLSYIHIEDLIVNDVAGGYKWSQTLGSRPYYLATGNGPGKAVLNILGQVLVDDITDPRCPFGAALDPVTAPGVYSGSLTDGNVTVNALTVHPDRRTFTLGRSTFTPALLAETVGTAQPAVTYTTQIGRASKQFDGLRFVKIKIRAQITNLNGCTGALIISGLPADLAPLTADGTQRMQASVEGAGVDWGTNWMISSAQISPAGRLTLNRTWDNKDSSDMPITGVALASDFTVNVWGMVQE